jgi:tryptophanyl-tRNA synthetase
MQKKASFIVTPWEVKGEVDYEKLIREFGTTGITDDLIDRLAKHTGDILHTVAAREVRC